MGESFSGGPLLETDLAGSKTAEYVYFNGKRTARIDANGSVHYYLSDHLGSTSIVASSTGAVENDSDYFPLGGERVVTRTGSNHFKFTGKERDTESGLDYFEATYYASSMGRFIQATRLCPNRITGYEELRMSSRMRGPEPPLSSACS